MSLDPDRPTVRAAFLLVILAALTVLGLILAPLLAQAPITSVPAPFAGGGTVQGPFGVAGANGQAQTLRQATALVSTPSGATVTATDLIPAGSVVLGVTVRVTTLMTGATAFDVGDGSDADRWGDDIAVAAGTTTTNANTTITAVPIYAAATSVVLTAVTSDFTAGAVRITVHYLSLTAPTS